MGTFHKLASLSALPSGSSVCVQASGKGLALFRQGERVFALDDECSHAQGPLSEGEFDGSKVICPWHGACFDVHTGRALSRPATLDVKSYPVRLQGDEIWVEL
jgi:3-phenylpropionate/trans-cinnamate dioxygenase ferredoxin subunit